MIKELLEALFWIFGKSSSLIIQIGKTLILVFLLVFLDSYFDFSRSIYYNHKYDELGKIQNLLQDSTLNKEQVVILEQNRSILVKSKSLSNKVYDFFFGFNDKHPFQYKVKYKIKNFSYFWYFFSFLPPFIIIAFWVRHIVMRDPSLGPKNRNERLKIFPAMFILCGFMYAFVFLKLTTPAENFNLFHIKVAKIYYGTWGIIITIVIFYYAFKTIKYLIKYYSKPKRVRQLSEYFLIVRNRRRKLE